MPSRAPVRFCLLIRIEKIVVEIFSQKGQESLWVRPGLAHSALTDGPETLRAAKGSPPEFCLRGLGAPVPSGSPPFPSALPRAGLALAASPASYAFGAMTSTPQVGFSRLTRGRRGPPAGFVVVLCGVVFCGVVLCCVVS